MGNILKKPAPEKAQGERADAPVKTPTQAEINEARNRGELVSLLLLGAGESGKSTILKQMIIIHGDGFAEVERRELKDRLVLSVLEGAYSILEAMKHLKRTVENEEAAKLVWERFEKYRTHLDPHGAMNEDVAQAILNLTTEPEFRRTITDGAHSKVQDGWIHLAQKLEGYPATWGGDTWIPSDDDILSCRIRTTGVVNNRFFQVDRAIYQMIDVGGQRAERRRYMKFFKNMNAILFVSSLSEYNQNLFEDAEENRLVDSLDLWRSTSASDLFAKSALLLFLNKLDIFQEKYYDKQIALPVFEDFDPPPKMEEEADRDCARAIAWFEALYKSKAPQEKQNSIFLHVTTAVKTNLMRRVIDDVAYHVMTQVLGRTGLVQLGP